MITLLTVLLAFSASVILTWRFIGWLKSRNLVAVENDRTMHQGAVPQGGGIPVVAATMGTTLLLWPLTGAELAVLIPALALAVLSAWNDRREIAAPVRLAAHAAAAFAALQLIPWNEPILTTHLPTLIDRALVALALVWFINLYNFMDGIDGITGVETISLAAGVLIVTHFASPQTNLNGLALSLMGASAGFLVWNWHKARIFLGDVGSIPLGLMTGMLLVKLAADVSLWPAVILPLYYVTDATVTLLRRVLRGEKAWQPHREHAYQRSARALGSHDGIVLRIAACNAALIVCAVLALQVPVAGVALAVAAVFILMRNLESIAGKAEIQNPTRAAS